eukprot:8557710-Heterocapsa_arctica.AAC.1
MRERLEVGAMVRRPWTCCGTTSPTAVGSSKLCACWASRCSHATGLRPERPDLPLGIVTVYPVVELAACEAAVSADVRARLDGERQESLNM